MSDHTPATPEKAALERLAYRPDEVMQILGIGRNGTYELLKTGKLASVRHGRRRIIPRAAIERFLEIEPA